MTKLALPLSAAALAVLAACSTTDPVAPAPAPVVYTAPPPAVVAAPPPATVVVQPGQVAAAPVVLPQPTALRSGHGRIESIHPTGVNAAAAGGSVKPLRRLGIKMNDGTVQYVDTAAENLSIGQRIEITQDGHIRH
jgi:hypothetical protein